MSKEGFDFSNTSTVGPYDPRSDGQVSGIPERYVKPFVTLFQDQLDSMREAILLKLPQGCAHEIKCNKQKLLDLSDVITQDIATINQTITNLESVGRGETVMYLKASKKSVLFSGLQLLLLEYWKCGDFILSDRDIRTFSLQPDGVYILYELLGEIIADDFSSSGNPEVSARVIAQKINFIEQQLEHNFDIPVNLHENYKMLIEVELELLRGSTFA